MHYCIRGITETIFKKSMTDRIDGIVMKTEIWTQINTRKKIAVILFS